MPASRLLRPLVAFIPAATLLTIAWARLEAGGVGPADATAASLLALAPAVLVALGARRLVVAAALGLAAVIAAGMAFGVSPLEARPGSTHDFFGPVLGGIRDGLQNFYESTLPFDPVDYPAMHGLVVFAIFGFAALAGMLAAARRTTGATLALLVGLGWPVTLVPGDRPLLAGALTLAGVLLYLLLARLEVRSWRSVVPPVVAGLVLVLAAVGASTSQAVSKGAFLDWQAWDLYDPPDNPVSVSYVWTARYGGITFPAKKTTVLKVKVDGPRRAFYWRATTLDEYNGESWNETSALGEVQPALASVDVAAGDPLLPKAAASKENQVRQEVSIEALRDNHLVGSAQPLSWQPGTSLGFQRAPGGSIVLAGNLRQGQKYTVTSYVARPKAGDLSDAGTNYPNDLPHRYLEPLQGAVVPEFGVPRRAAYMRGFFANPGDAFIADNRRLYELARRVTRDAKTPYAAALVLESWFRNPSAGGFTYDQHPPVPPAINYPPLLDFVLDTRRGYCQHFAGAMTLMLRFLGIPARIAAGFTSGTYDAGSHTWKVTDHNAHTWVEVYFPGWGWLPFDPTPGRGTLDAPYSYASTPGTQLGEKAPDLARIAALAGVTRLGPDGVGRESPRTGREGTAATGAHRGRIAAPSSGSAGSGGSPVDTSLIAFLAVVAGCGSVAIVLAKLARRQLRFTTRDPRRVAAACRSDLVGFLRDQGADPAPSATAAELGRYLESEFAVDADPYVRNVAAARYGPLAGAPGAARTARRELGRLRREMWRQLTWGRRIRTALSFRSFAG